MNYRNAEQANQAARSIQSNQQVEPTRAKQARKARRADQSSSHIEPVKPAGRANLHKTGSKDQSSRPIKQPDRASNSEKTKEFNAHFKKVVASATFTVSPATRLEILQSAL